MSIPSRVKGAGNNSSARNVFRIVFSQALSSIPRLEAWDDGTFTTSSKELFVGTVVNGNIPMLSAVATTDAAPASNWKPVSPVGGGATINRLKGSSSFVNLAVAAPGAGGNIRFNLVWEIPSDATVPSAVTMDGRLAVRISFSGPTPALTWQFNDDSAGGIEAAPVWTTITPGSAGHKVRPADAGVSSANVLITKPTSSTADSAEVWVTAT